MSGYDVKDTTVYTQQGTAVKPEDLDRLKCKICGFVLKDAVQITNCGHRFCKECLSNHMATSTDQGNRCPEDDERFEAIEVKKDRGCQREIASLQVHCSCSWRGPLVEIEGHMIQCPNTLVSCTLNCGEAIRRDALTLHLTADCIKRDLVCTYCHRRIQSDVIEAHYLECDEIPSKCEYCHVTISNRKSLQKHQENDCSKVVITCPTCMEFKGDRKALTKHMNTHILEMGQLLQKSLERIDRLETKLEEMEAEKDKERNEMQQIILRLEKRVKVLEFAPQTGLDKDITNGTGSNHYGALSASPKTAKKDVKRFNESHNFNDKMDSGIKEEMRSQEMKIMKISETLQSVQSSVTQQSVAIDEVRLRQDILDVKVTGGTLIWKIPDLRRRYRDAVERRTLSLYSPPFYTSPHGYRMCIRTYLNGDGIGKGTHISMFFVLMRSEHDNLLSWPFKQSVRFTLLNQKNPGASISEAFIPDMKSASFHKPESEMNIASGFPKFARQSILQDENYIVGDMIFIKCQVDSTGLKLE